MRLDELLRFVGRFFESRGVDHLVFGATAMNFWVPPRNTIDLDVMVTAEKRRAAGLLDALRKEGFPVTRDRTRKFLEGRIVKIPLGDSELDLKLKKTAHEREAFDRARWFQAEDYRLKIAVPEDLVLFKLQYWRKQDEADIERILKDRKDLDSKYIEAWLGRLEEATGFPLRERWDDIRRS